MNIPNILTCLRIALIPVFYMSYTSGDHLLAMIIFALASFTDFLDGRLARKLNQITSFGKLADPLADKIMVLTALYCLAADSRIPWFVLIIILAKEAFMVVGALCMLGKKIVVQANIWGKLATVCFIASFIMVFPWHGIEPIYTVGLYMVYVSALLSVCAMVNYTIRSIRQLKRKDC